MLAQVIVVFIVCFSSNGINRTLAVHLKAGIINGVDVGNPIVDHDGKTIYLPDGEYPYMASVEANGWSACGAVIIHESVAITAAHCINRFNISTMAVRAGHTYEEDTREPSQVSKVSHGWYHPYFENKHYEYDIGLLFLETPFVFNKYVNKIKIEYNKDYTGETFTALGFGMTSESERGDLNLKKADLTVISTLECRKKAEKYWIDSSMICAADKNEKQNVCFGDSGGPFVKHYPGHPEKDFLVAIASWVPGTCDPKVVGVYASVHASEYFLKDQFYTNKVSI